MEPQQTRRSGGCQGRLLIAIVIAVISIVSYYGMNQQNPVTGENQHIDISAEQEVALGLQAAPEVAQQFGGLDSNQRDQQVVDQIGNQVLNRSDARKSPYQFEFHLLSDPKTINAFALPGGQVFITRALFDEIQTPGQLAGVLGHEIGHVVGRHSAEQIAKQKLSQGLTGAAVIASTDPSDPGSYKNAAVAQMIGQLVNLRFSRENELESDRLGVRFMAQSGFDPRSMIGVMEILAKAGGSGGPEFFKTHPNPENRVQKIEAAIEAEFPSGLPDNLTR